MATFSTRIETSREPADAFSYLVDLSHAARYDPRVVSAVQTSAGVIGPGTTFRLLVSAPGQALPLTFRIDDLKPGEAVTFVCETRLARLEERFHVAPRPEGGAVAHYERSVEPHGLLGRVDRLLGRRLPRLCEPVATGLRRVLGPPA